MAKAKGINKRVTLAKESVFGVAALAGDVTAKQYRRITADFNLKRAAYESTEIRFDHQSADMRLGTRSAEGSINGELSPGTYSDLLGSILEKDFAAGAIAASVSLTITASGSNFTLTRATGSFLTDTFKVGTVVRLTGSGLNASNVSNNLLIISVSALALTVQVLSSTPLVPEGPIATVAVTTAGKVSYVPLTGHTDDSFTAEQWFADIAQSEVYTGLKVQSAAISLPATGLVTSNFAMTGKDLAKTGTAAYFTSPVQANTKGIFSAVNGALILNGDTGACITSMNMTIERSVAASTCIGTDSAEDIFTGRIKVTGTFESYFEDGSLRELFATESVVSLVMALTASEAKDSEVMTFVLPNVKLTSTATKDAELSIMQSAAFTALLNVDTSAGLVGSTILIQDTAA